MNCSVASVCLLNRLVCYMELFIVSSAFALAVIIILTGMISIRRRELKEIAKFQSGPRSSDAEFLNGLELDLNSSDAQKALMLRKMISESGQVPSDTIQVSQKFYPDLQRLPFYDSPDVLEFILTIEKMFDVKVHNDDGLLDAFLKGTVAEFIHDVLRWLREHEQD